MVGVRLWDFGFQLSGIWSFRVSLGCFGIKALIHKLRDLGFGVL